MDDSNSRFHERPLDIVAVRAALKSSFIGPDLRYFPALDSTNRFAAALPEGRWRHGTVVITDFQESGRGRRGRTWQAPPYSSLLLSLLFSPAANIPLSFYVMAAALAVRQAVGRSVGLDLEIKWPNDLEVGGRKVCGLLAESQRHTGNARVIVGLGLNVNVDFDAFPELSKIATSLSQELGRPVDREVLVVELFTSLDLWYGRLTRTPDQVFEAWKSALSTLGRRLLVHEEEGAWAGIAVGVHHDGALVVRTDSGQERIIYAADVSVRTAEDSTVR